MLLVVVSLVAGVLVSCGPSTTKIASKPILPSLRTASSTSSKRIHHKSWLAVSAASATQVATEVAKTYASVSAFEADFTYSDFSSGASGSGHAVFMVPGKFRLEFKTPPGDLIVSNGSSLWIYQAAGPQLRTMPLADSWLALVFAFVGEPLTDKYTLMLMEPHKGIHRVQATPLSPSGFFSRAWLTIDSATYEVTGVGATCGSESGGLGFQHPMLNPAINQSLFKWQTPTPSKGSGTATKIP